MVFTVQTCAMLGLEPHLVSCEVDLSLQLPSLSLVGLPSSLTQESRERVRAAVVNSGFEWPARKVTINLLPAHLPKWGSHFELAMALGVLGATMEAAPKFELFALGELSLSGRVRPCGWAASLGAWLKQRAHEAASRQQSLLVLASTMDMKNLSVAEPDLKDYCDLAPADTLAQAVALFQEACQREGVVKTMPSMAEQVKHLTPSLSTLAEVQGEPLGVTAAIVALAGGHHSLFAGPHGMGKSMLIRAIYEGLQPLSPEERARRAAVLTSFGDVSEGRAFEDGRPVVHLQTSVTRASLEGSLLNTGQVLPGEFTRAHLGVLVADEVLEMRRDVIEAFRQPLEEGLVRLQRAKFRSTLPADFQLLASTNLCPCGHFSPDSKARKLCRCQGPRLADYQRKLSGPFIDRFDLIVLVGNRDQTLECFPKEVRPLIEKLTDQRAWSEMLSQFWAKVPGTGVTSHREDLPEGLSRRGRAKILGLARTIAGLMDKPLAKPHFQLALALRQPLDLHLSDPLVRYLKKYSHSRVLPNT